MARRLLTPNEVRTATLHVTWLRGGYDTDETDELLDDCAWPIQVLTAKLAELVETNTTDATGSRADPQQPHHRMKGTMMTTNVTQKDETLKQVIAYCKKKITDIGNGVDTIEGNYDSDAVFNQLLGQVDAYKAVALKCINLLGYSGSMPLEAENQSEDARQEAGNAR